jgi:hypothetical protein
MPKFTLLLAVLVLLCSQAFAWQFKTESSGSTSLKVPLYDATAIGDGAGPATTVQIKNTGTGTLTVSMHLFISGTTWRPTHPFGATSGGPFAAVSDSVATLGAGETFTVEALEAQGVHALYVTRPVATSFKVVWQ